MKPRTRRTGTLLLLLGSVLIALLFTAPRFWQRMCGNQAIQLYGRIVDEGGVPVAEAVVSYRITYSDHITLPIVFGRGEQFRTIETHTDANGDYSLRGVYGYHVDLVRVTRGGREMQSAMGIPCDRETGWSLDDAFARQRLPDAPQRRITYTFRDRR